MAVSIPSLLIDAFCSVVRGLYLLFFAWWLNPLLKRDGQRRLRKQVSRDLPFLFNEFGARPVLTSSRDPWGKILTLEAGNLFLRFARDRGDYFLDIAPTDFPNQWAPISVAHVVITASKPIYTADDLPPAALSFRSFSELAPMLQSEFGMLQKAYSKENYASTRQQLRRVDEILGISEVRRLVRTHPGSMRENGDIQTLGL